MIAALATFGEVVANDIIRAHHFKATAVSGSGGRRLLVYVARPASGRKIAA